MGARLVKDINPAGSSSPNELISVNGLLFFSAEIAPQAASNNGEIEESPGNEEINAEAETSADSEAQTSDEETSSSTTNLSEADGSQWPAAGTDCLGGV